MLSDTDNKLQDAIADATTPYDPDLGEIGSPPATESQPDDDGRLSTIPEDSEEEREIWLLSYFLKGPTMTAFWKCAEPSIAMAVQQGSVPSMNQVTRA